MVACSQSPEVDGPWAPWSVLQLAERLRDVPFRWWVAGGSALELHVGQRWRTHDDVDLGVLGADLPQLAKWFDECELYVAAAGKLSAYLGQPLSSARSENNVWVRERASGAWKLDLLISAGDQHAWIYRRDPSLRRAWSGAVLRGLSGIPYLAPELQLLFKSKHVRAKDTLDAERVIPCLTRAQQAFLAEQLIADHPWRVLLRAP